MQPFRRPSRRAQYQPKEPKPAPRSIPDQAFNELFAGLACNRDRALIAFYISTGARASRTAGCSPGLVAPEEQTISVVRKGSRALQQLPASTDAFVWLRLYQQEMLGLVPRGPDEPVWWTLRRPFRPLTYDAARMVFARVNRMLGANWTLHDLRHSAAKRMVRDPHLTLADVQWVLGHAHLSTTQIYTAPTADEVIAHVLAHHERQRTQQAGPPAPPAPGYRPEVLAVLFGTSATSGEPDEPAGPRQRRRQRDAQAVEAAVTGRSAGVGATALPGELVADPPGQGGAGHAVAGPVHRPGRGPRPGQDTAARPDQAAGLAAAPARGHLAGEVAGQRADAAGSGWTDLPLKDRVPAREHQRDELRSGLVLLMAGQVLRPGYRWLLRQRQALMLAEARAAIDPGGFRSLELQARPAIGWARSTP